MALIESRVPSVGSLLEFARVAKRANANENVFISLNVLLNLLLLK